MAKVLSKPVAATYQVDDWTVSFYQMSEGDHLELEGFKRETIYEEGNWIGFREEINERRDLRKMIYRTMGSCDLEWEAGKLIFNSKDGRVRNAMTEQQFNQQWNDLPQNYADAIIEKFKEHNPDASK